MIKELIIKETKKQLKLLIEDAKEQYFKILDEEEREIVKAIINKKTYELEDINDLLINYFSYELDNYELLQLIKTNSNKKKKFGKKEKILLYVIEYYLVSLKEYEVNIIEFFNNISINDINVLDEYLCNRDYQDNDKILNVIDRISNAIKEVDGIKNKTNDIVSRKNNVQFSKRVNNMSSIDNLANDANNKKINISNQFNVDNSSIKNIIDDLKRIIILFRDNLINLDLINALREEKILRCDNYYFQYKEVWNSLISAAINEQERIDSQAEINQQEEINSQEKVNLQQKMSKIEGRSNQKEIVLLCLTFLTDIDLFKNIKLEKEDLLSFLKKVEDKGFTLNTKQINNLFDNFRKKYYQDNEKNDEVTLLKNKVIEVYSDYYSKNFYFKVEDFIEYYNNLYNDDFSAFTFSKSSQKLNRNIFDSIFYNYNINESFIALENELEQFNSLKTLILDYKINSLENEKTYYERYKFYLMYLDKVKEYFNYYESITIEYYILKNIPDNHRGTFYELFKCYYGSVTRKIGRGGKAIANSCKLLRQEYLEELMSCELEKRYEILNKYKKYCLYLNSLALLNEKHLLEIMKEYEDGYYNVDLSKKTKRKKHTS